MFYANSRDLNRAVGNRGWFKVQPASYWPFGSDPFSGVLSSRTVENDSSEEHFAEAENNKPLG